jgi:hypothetical protein
MNGPPQKFNDDLLVTPRDRELAADTFPDILHVLDFPELRQLFSSYDVPAKRAKRHRRVIGSVAIIAGVSALLGASVALLHDNDSAHWPRYVAGASAVMGVLSLLLGSVGALAGPSKRRWLCSRLMTERLRQFHFQTMVCRLPEILGSMADSKTRGKFLDQRRTWFAEYRLAYEGHLPARLRTVLDDDAEEDFWLHPDRSRDCSCDPADASVATVFSAYRLLRFEHQIQYANYRLGADEGIFSSSATRQLEILRNVALVFILVIFVSNLALAALLGFGALSGLLSPGAATPSPGAQSGILTTTHVHIAIIWLFIGIVAMRTLEEGLQPAREVERYTRYRSSMVSLMRRFDAAIDPREKIEIMREAERASYQEMRSFLRTHNDARYVL